MKNLILTSLAFLISCPIFSIGEGPKRPKCNEDFQFSQGLTAVYQKTTTLHAKTGVKNGTQYDCSVAGTACDVTIIIVTADAIAPSNPPGFNPPAEAQIAKCTATTDFPDNPPTIWIPATVIDVNVIGGYETWDIPEQKAYYSPENDAYLFYHN